MKKINLSTWKRKQHFEFFNQFEEPYFGLTVTVDVTIAMQKQKKKGFLFFNIIYINAC
ncbi:CatA-like O-acetyltransferase [Dokdonia ponticola]|uniref:CatA-like O-acetyltransferase n=1 Tax=Dokdonia ponticola TaxID=2041041 RepID=A0ABV9HUJ2_9FLAO